MKRTLALGTCAALVCASTAAAQSSRKAPAVYRGPEPAAVAAEPPPGIRLALGRAREFSLGPLSAADRARLAQPSAMVRVGVHRSVSPQATGDWVTASDGSPLWRLALRSPGAEAMRVEFRDFAVGPGKVWVHNGSDAVGPYSGNGPYGNGQFWSASLLAESITVEYQPGPEAAQDGAPPFTIRTVAHRARRTTGRLDTTGAAVVDTADYCELDPNCYPDWKSSTSMVAAMVFELDGEEALCSGSAIATRDNSFKPYLLTAGHCIHSEAAARSLETYWNYQTSSCGGAPPASRGSGVQGGHLIGSGSFSEGDYSLVLLPSVPSGVTFEGWDTGDPQLGEELTGIHHPRGSWKRISFGNRVADAPAIVEGDLAPANLYLQVQWAQGVAEPGSSGSPLYSAPGVVVGTLTYGPDMAQYAACSVNPLVNGYARFSNTYTHLSDYFENLPAAAVVPDRSNLLFTVANQTASAAQTIALTTQSAGQAAFKLRADAPWIQLSRVSGTLSQGAPAQVQISVDPSWFKQPDKYTSTVTVLSGAAAPRYINVTADARIPQSNVTVTISPNPVTLSGGLWSFAVQLSEGNGVATQLTSLKINGVDYTSSIPTWFGTNAIPANGAITAPLAAPSTFPKGTQYFEFLGADAGSSQDWYRVATVVLQ